MLERGYVRGKLEENFTRRQTSAQEFAAAREELEQLLRRGVKAGLSVTEMARLAGIRRDGAQKILSGTIGRPRFMDNELEATK